MAAYTLYDVLRHLASQAAWPSEEDKAAAVKSITDAEMMGVLGNVARNMECPHTHLSRGVCDDCGRTIEVGHGGPRVQTGSYTRQGWR